MLTVDIAHVAPTSIVTLSALSGLASHWLYFIRGEHHLEGIFIVNTLILTFLLVTYFFAQSNSVIYSLFLSSSVISAYVVSLWTSMFIYRGLFHPLRNFSGPPLAKYSKLYHAYLDRNLDNFLVLDRLHGEYGEVFRIGPNELSIISPSAMNDVYGAQSKCSKSNWYDPPKPSISLHQCRDKDAHNARRRVWDKGFSTKSLNEYETRVSWHTDKLMDRFAEMSGTSFNASLWLNFYSFDVMGDMAFGRSFNMLESGEEHFAVKLLHEGMLPVGILGTMPWAIQFLGRIPFIGGGYKRFLQFCDDRVTERQNAKGEKPDVFSWLLKAPGVGQSKEALEWLNGDARLIIVAGSDTTAATLTYLFYEFAKDPSVLRRIREEVEKKAPSGSNRELATCDYLSGCINEALRLHPPVPSGMMRMTPPEGVTIDGISIPGNVNVCVPQRQAGRDPRYYREPLKFMPERWFSQPEYVINTKTFAPFGGGVYSCVGKQLALMELRMVAARAATQFDIKFAPGEDGTNLMTKTKDTFTVVLAPMEVILTKRE